MTFKYLQNFFLMTSTATNADVGATTTATSKSCKHHTTCLTLANICKSNNNSITDSKYRRGSSSSCSISSGSCVCSSKTCCFHKNNTSKAKTLSLRLKPTALKRKIRKTSRRKRKRKCGSNTNNNNKSSKDCSVNTSSNCVNMVDNIMVTSSNKCKLSVNNTGNTELLAHVNKYEMSRKYETYSKNTHIRKDLCKNCQRSHIRSSANINNSTQGCCCFCKCNKNEKTIKKILLPQETQTETTKLAQTTTLVAMDTASATISNRKVFINKEKRKKLHLHLEQKPRHQLKYLYPLEKYVKITITAKKEQAEITSKLLLKSSTNTKSSTLLTSSAETSSTTSSLPSSSPCLSALPTTHYSRTFETALPNYNVLATAAATNTYSCPTSSSFSTWYSLTRKAPTRILNELYGVIFMTLLVLSICHNNVLETSAAAVKMPRRDEMANMTALAALSTDAMTTIRPWEENGEGLYGEGLQHKQLNPPEQILEQYQHLTSSFLSQEVERQKSLEREMREDQSNHIFQPQIPTESLPVYQQYEREQLEKIQQQFTAGTTSTSSSQRDMLESPFNKTFRRFSTLNEANQRAAVDRNEQRMIVQEEMLAEVAGGKESNFDVLQPDIGNNEKRSYDSTAQRYEDVNMIPNHVATNSMPIFDYGMPRNITARTGHTEAIIKCRVDRLADKSISWIRKRDLHILTVGTATYTSDKRFQVTESKDSREWTLHVKSPQARDSGIYECQVNTEPKMSMAFQLNVIEISPDAKAFITGEADLHFKAGSAIILTCTVQQPSVRDIGPIYWYRGDNMITPFDINDIIQKESSDSTATDILNLQKSPDDILVTAGKEKEHIVQAGNNEISQDFAQRIAMESQLGDTMKSRLRISNAQTSDTGNYTCQPTTASSASVMVYVINDESPAAMQKSGAYSFHQYKHTKTLTNPLVSATIVASFTATLATILQIICGRSKVINITKTGYC